MKIIGLTGGIGSGKTTVANFFKELGIPVYIADDAGKRLMNSDEQIKQEIKKLIGEKAYSGEVPDRKYIASKVFKDKALLNELNGIIHPAVAKDFDIWLKDQHSPYVIYEAAILFEIGRYDQCDHSVLVVTPKDLRIQRIQERDKSTREEILDRMDNQWSDEKKSELADFIIKNTDLAHTKSQVAHIHAQILKAGKNS
ncbi:dephospho-CoA kinase [Christiangramia salexigens]|uniref:Dephospho-CoA kinase n=1 Tax=Christiangramia salexigens TaxID=1913577 RepID=A0A1L3J1J7_9FLAO|nr:dephospho-CoA kinase [Christiangramia salexigens]APG58993.1 dephospho-CoA kinase [Christiangramia salexigens]